MFRLPRVYPGEVITTEHINVLYEALERCRLSVASGSGLRITHDQNGDILSLESNKRFFIKLTASGNDGSYGWTMQIPDDNGQWVDGPAEGILDDDPAYEANGNSQIDISQNPIVEAERTPFSVVFQLAQCGQ